MNWKKKKNRRKRLWFNKETYAGIFVARLIETTGNFRAASAPAIFDASISPFQA
jgi:uncharacterized protein Veg